ncbi:response regulator transcription factor [Cohnella caldifontis]|uniref:response regulator transcription factor n=1 Tax=Cohnella caldifontis TaxID=3027471 RepID=UPI0023EDF0D0|nr:response regulator transcription factor [Cohnella sp. YIM B05605]
MLKVMIADDESWIRKGLKAMIEWDRLGLACDAEAVDGWEALELAETRMPDILITDVRMPGIDGLQLAARMLERSPRLKVLMISGYSEFEYVKSAIQLDAVSYILKPINPAELNGALGKAVDRLRSEKKEELLAGQLPGYLEKLAGDLCLGRAGASGAQAFRDTLQLQNMAAEYLACAIFHYDDSQYDAETMAHLLERAEASWTPEGKRLILWERGSRRIAAVVLCDGRRETAGDLSRLLLALKRMNVGGVRVSVGDAVRIGECDKLSRSCREAWETAERHPFQSEIEVMSYSPAEEEPPGTPYPLHLQKKLADLMALGDLPGMEAAAQEIGAYYRGVEGATMKHVRSFYLGIVTEIVKTLLAKPSFHEDLVQKGFDFCLRLDRYEDLRRLTDWLLGYLREIHAVRETAGQRDVQRNILAAADYIREHYAEEISLNSVSTRFFITSTYFSSMFKEVIGENFLEFLTRIRMEHAKELLEHSALKVGQIGERVGYADSRYFSKLFKKQTGLMPTEYRQSRSGDFPPDREEPR